ncbi:MAG: MFS transporter [Proteobacteria bacterium]|nr:MFS transporter [Pseudomonadota bacterium]
MTDIIGALRQPEVRQRSLVLVASLLFMLVGTGSIYFIVVALKQISAEFAWPRAVPSIAYALQYGGAGLGGIFMGWLLDRRGMMIPAFIGATMVGLGAILTSFIQTQWELFFIYGVMLGFFGRSSLFAPLTANITRWFEHNKSLAVGIVGSGQGLAGLMWPQVFHYLMAAVGWRQAALLYGLFALATMLPLAMILRKRPPAAKATAPRRAGRDSDDTSVRPPLPPRTLQLLLSTAAIGCCVAMSLPLAHIVSHVSDLGYDSARGAEVLSLMLGCSALASFFGVGFLGGRFGGLRAIFLFSATQATLLFVLAFVDNLTTVYLAAALFGLGYGGILPCYPVIVRELLPAAEAGRRTGLVLLCAGGGMALGSWLGGYVFDLTGSYQIAFLIGVGFNLGNLAIITGLILRTRSLRPAFA